ncbi:hypothetical protein [Marinactinospora thermotolerans]|uniref:hypothetical protein n=1 Tax=Marinactinospora thermotolerans TaxID=531310 RepID=UPI00099A2EC6|nr:hypothetical protein [Marinactinospora thermotolerans]
MRWIRGLVATLCVVGVVALVAVLGGRWVSDRLAPTALPWGPACSVETSTGTVGLTVEEARRATTAVALEARGAEAPATDGIDPLVLERLRSGPPDDAGPSLTCRAQADADLPVEEMTDTGLTPRAERVRTAMAEVFGEQSLGGFQPGGVDSGHGADSAHYDGRAIDIFYRPVDEENRRAGWLLAHWLVAHAEELDLAVIIFDDRIWSTRFSVAGWRDYDSPDPTNEILRHLDHVHVDVQRGAPASG